MNSGPRWNPFTDGLGMNAQRQAMGVLRHESRLSGHGRSGRRPLALPCGYDPPKRAAQRELHDYLVAHSAAPDDVLSQLAAETAAAFPAAAGMQIGPEQGTFMTLLTQLTGASRALEIGTFTGYSSICIARGLAAAGS